MDTIMPMPQECPQCESGENLDFASMEYADDEHATETVTCAECDVSWTNTWKLIATEAVD